MTNLPAEPSSFVGRVRELQEVRQALETTRLLTLTGTGGTGKTRLAIAGANAVLDAYPGGVWLVELAAVRQPALVARALGDVLGIREPRGTTLVERIAAHIDQRRVLISWTTASTCSRQCSPGRGVAGCLSAAAHPRDQQAAAARARGSGLPGPVPAGTRPRGRVIAGAHRLDRLRPPLLRPRARRRSFVRDHG